MTKKYYTENSGQRYYDIRSKCRNEIAQAESALKFAPYIDTKAVVLDFGCGTGGILSNIKCSRRIGIEVNEPSVNNAIEKGIEIFRDINDVPDNIADVIMTHHALEHIENPFEVLQNLYKKLKSGGRIIVVVPAENPHKRNNRSWRQDDEAKHLYSWNPLTLGNLIAAAGYKVDKATIIGGGYSHYIEILRPFPMLFNFSKISVAYLMSRYDTICIGSIHND